MKSAIEELEASKVDLAARFAAGEVREAFQEIHSEMVDRYFRRSIQESRAGQRLFREGKHFAVVAVGGYGRKELCLHSDLDVLFVFDSRIPVLAKDLAEQVLYPLWDIGLDLGHGIRTITDCLALARRDFEVLASLLDARFICGKSPVFLSLVKQIQEKTLPKKARAFEKWLAAEYELRIRSFGDASYLLEPNVKEGVGGLRDYHHILWLSRAFLCLRSPRDLEYLGVFSHREYRDLEEIVRFIGLVRNHLHRLSGRRNDRLTFDQQEKIAPILGFRNGDGALGVERFLGKLHADMALLKSLHRTFVLTHIPGQKGSGKKEEEPGIDSATTILRDPLTMAEIFAESCRLHRPLSLESKRLIREFLYLIDDGFRSSERAVRAFLFIMNHERAFETLDQMMEVGYLGAFFPEFALIRDRVQYDNYHIYPVGRHALQTLHHLKALGKETDLLLLAIMNDLPEPEPLFLASLFHDIGKNGKDHARKGMLITRGILKRMAYDKAKGEEILFLVNHHLLLSETATRRDLNDEKIVVQCAGNVGTVERLKMLYLLTWADSRATGPRAWNDWIGNLVLELFFKVLHTLERGELATPDASRRVRHTLQKVRTEIGSRITPSELEQRFEAMSPRYLLERKASEIVGHLLRFRTLRQSLKDHPPSLFSLETREGFPQGTYEVTFLGRDRPGLFADIAGVMALNNINVLSAYIYTWRDGTVVDIFTVTGPLDPMRSQEIWNRVKRDLEQAFSGAFSIGEGLKEKARPSILTAGKKWHRAPEVRIDNQSSDFFTLIEVFAEDRIGLLYRATHALFLLGLDIRIAKIATKKDQVADVFYVRDMEGEKVLDETKIDEIRCALLLALAQ